MSNDETGKQVNLGEKTDTQLMQLFLRALLWLFTSNAVCKRHNNEYSVTTPFGYKTGTSLGDIITQIVPELGDVNFEAVVDKLAIPNQPVETILQEAQRLVHGDRNADYGHPIQDFRRTAAIVTVMLEHKLKMDLEATDIPIIMMAVKLSRHFNKYKRDNLVDLCGYAETLEMCKKFLYEEEVSVTTFGESEAQPASREERPTPTLKYRPTAHVLDDLNED